MSAIYRDTCLPTKTVNSSDEGEVDGSSSDSDGSGALWKKKRSKPLTKINNGSSSVTNINNGSSGSKKKGKSKNAMLWGSVLTEQSSNDISSSLGAVGMKHCISRGPESFDIPSSFMSRPRRKSEEAQSNSSASEEEKVEESHQTNGHSEQIPKTQKTSNAAKSANKRKRKRPQNKSNNIPAYKPGQEVTLNKRCELSDTDPVDKVAEEIAFRLWERKRDLIRSLTETVGVPAAIDFCNKTEDIEKNGGLLTNQGSRRRTPGGTFIHLIRNDPRLDQEPINTVFALEAERERVQWEQKKLLRKIKKAEHRENIMSLQDPSGNTDITPKQETMECNDVIATSHNPDVESHLTRETVDQNNANVALLPQAGASGTQMTSINTVTSSRDDGELSEGEILDSEEEDKEGQLQEESETFG